MKFYLVKEKHVLFTDIPSKTKPYPNEYSEKEVSVSVDLQLDDANSDDECESFLNLIKSIIHNGSSKRLARKCLHSEEKKYVGMKLEKQ